MSVEFDRQISDELAQNFLGMEFELGGRGEGNKIDCYGIAVRYYEKFGLKLPDYSSSKDWAENEERILREYADFFVKLKSIEELETGDMILFRSEKDGPMSHIGIYLGNHMFIHAYEKIGVKIESFTKNKIWKELAVKFFRPKEKE